jgi:hypothetical protein
MPIHTNSQPWGFLLDGSGPVIMSLSFYLCFVGGRPSNDEIIV